MSEEIWKTKKHVDKSLTIRWENIPNGAILKKFTSVDEGSGDYEVEIHGFYDENGNIIIIKEIVRANP